MFGVVGLFEIVFGYFVVEMCEVVYDGFFCVDIEDEFLFEDFGDDFVCAVVVGWFEVVGGDDDVCVGLVFGKLFCDGGGFVGDGDVVLESDVLMVELVVNENEVIVCSEIE